MNRLNSRIPGQPPYPGQTAFSPPQRAALLAVVAFHLWTTALLAGTVQSSQLRAEIDDATGALSALAAADGLPLLDSSPDRYVLAKDSKTETIASEADDRVSARQGQVWICTNPTLVGIHIEKSYVAEGAWLTKKVRFRAERRDLGLLKYGATSRVSRQFYADAYLNDPSRHPLDYPYVLTRTLNNERAMADSHSVADHYLVICTNPRLDRGLAQYRLRVNGRFVQPLSSYAYEPSLVYGPQGWRMGCAAAWMSDDREPLTCEVRWHAFRGDHLAFHRQYLDLPESRSPWVAPVPAWLKRVKGVTSWTWGENSLRLTRYKNLADSLPDDGLLLVMIGGVFCNTRAYLADPIPNAMGLPLSAAQLRQVVDGLHALSPKIRVGPVTWHWGFGTSDPVYTAHPEWTVHGGDGQPAFAATGWCAEKVYSQLLTPECRQFVLEQFRGMVARYDFDFIYMDTGQGGVTRFDWPTRRNAQDYDWADLYEGIRGAARSHRDGMAFFNGTPRLYSVAADCGYFEGVGIFPERDWRALADRLVLVKLYQPGDRWTMPLYWTEKRKQEYINYCLLLGLKPGGFLEGSAASRWPLTAAAEELVAARLVPEAAARPCWWREATEVECYALRLPRAAVLTALNHGPKAEKVRLSCEVRPLGLDRTRPLHRWLFVPATLEEIERQTRVTEAEANAIFAREGIAPHRSVSAQFLGTSKTDTDRFTEEVELPPGRTILVLLTQADVLAHSVAGRPTQLLLPPPPGERCETISAAAPVPKEIAARRDGIELRDRPRSPLLARQQSSPQTMNRMEQAVGRKLRGVEVVRFLALDCEHNLEDKAGFDAQRLQLWADSGEDKVLGFASAGVEARNLGKLRLRVDLKGPLYKKFATSIPACFTGLVADYHTSKGYTWRVLFPLAPCGESPQAGTRPWWGASGQKGDRWAVPLERKGEITLDLGRYAPEGWDGTAILGVSLECSSLGVRLEAEILDNGPPGPRDPHACRLTALRPRKGKAGEFRGAAIDRLEDGATIKDGAIDLPAGAAVEAVGLRVVTWKLTLPEKVAGGGIWVNFHRTTGQYQLVRLGFDGPPLSTRVRLGGESRFDLDLGQFAPQDWDGRTRIRLKAPAGASAAIVDNSSFQVY